MERQPAPPLPPPSGVAPARVQVGLESMGSESLIEAGLHAVQGVVNSARQSRDAREIDLVSLADNIPGSIRDDIEKLARDQELGPAEIVATIGVRVRGDGDDREANELALPFLEAAGELDDAMAAYTAGRVILDLDRDPRLAREWLLKGASGGDPQAQYNLGKMLWEDDEVLQAEHWLEASRDERAAELLARIRREALTSS